MRGSPFLDVASATKSSVTATYAYDADSQRERKTIGSSSTYFLRGKGGELLTEWTDPGTSNGRARDYVYLGSRLLAAVARNRTDEPTTSYDTTLTPSHKSAIAWHFPNAGFDDGRVNHSVTAAARKSNHPDMPRAGLRLGSQSTGAVTHMVDGPVMTASSNQGDPDVVPVFHDRSKVEYGRLGRPPTGQGEAMKKSRYSEEQVAYALRLAESGTPVADVCRQIGIAEATFYLWKKKYGGLGVSEVRELRQMREENARLKRLVADLTLDKQILQEVIRKKI